jgi:trk/ktr system potassium uptake protein
VRLHRVVRLLGTVFKVYAFFLLIPIAGSLYWDEDVGPSAISRVLPFDLKVTTASFALVAVFIFLLGFLLTSVVPEFHEDLREREAYVVVAAGWLFCAMLGALPFLLAGTTSSLTVALFEAMSALTTTGYTALPNPLEQYPPSIHLWRGTMHFFGGMGIVLVIYAIVGRLTEGGHKLMGSETGGEVSRVRSTLSQTSKSLFGVYVTLNLLLFLALWVAIRHSPIGLGWKASAYHALVHAFGSIATGGMGTLTLSAEGFRSPWVESLIFVGMFLGGTSFVLLFELVVGPVRSALFKHGEFRFYVAVLAAASIAVGLSLLLAGMDFDYAFGKGAFMVMSALATCGYTSIDPNRLPDAARLVLVLLMVTGGMVGSTVGAIKLARIQLLLQLTTQEIRHLLHPHAVTFVKMAGRLVPETTTRRVVVFFFTYTTVLIAGTFGFAFLGHNLSDSLVASAASLGGVGFGWGTGAGFAEPVGDLARLLGTVLMWLGRLEIFTVLLLFVPATYRS